MPTSTSDLWLEYADQLRQLVTTGQFDPETQLITFAGTTLAFDAANPDPLQAAAAVYNVGNIVPKVSASYAVNGDLAGGYALFLDYIRLQADANPNLDSQLNVAAGALTTAQTNFQQQASGAYTAWQLALKTSNPNISFNDYVRQFYPTYTSARNAMTAAQARYEGLLLQRYGPGYATINDARQRVSLIGGARDVTSATKFNMPVSVGTLSPAGSSPTLPGQTPPPPPSSLLTSYAPAYGMPAFTSTYQEWQTKSANGTRDASISISGKKGSIDTKKFGWTAGLEASFSYGFFRLFGEGSAEGSSLDVNTQSTEFSVEFTFTGLQAFPIGPAQQWYQAAIIQTYRDQLAPGAPDFFAADGALPLMPAQAIVGFEPGIILSLSNDSYSKIKTTFSASASASLSIGPFRIGSASVSTVSDRESVNWDDSRNTITIGPVKSTVPNLLGVICSKF